MPNKSEANEKDKNSGSGKNIDNYLFIEMCFARKNPLAKIENSSFSPISNKNEIIRALLGKTSEKLELELCEQH